MSKLIMISVLIATMAIPMRLAGAPLPKKSLQRAVRLFLLFNFIYVIMLVYLVPRLL